MSKTSILIISILFFLSCNNQEKLDLYNIANYYIVSDTVVKSVHNQNLVQRYLVYKNDTNYAVFIQFGGQEGKCDSLVGFFHKNKKNGPFTIYYSGKINYRGYFKEGLQDGLQLDFDKNGDTSKVVLYKDGVQVKYP